MKIKFLNISIIILTFFAICAYAQDNSKSDSEIQWTRIETADKDLSVAFPPDFIVDAEKRERGQKYKIYGFKNDVRMTFSLSKDSNAKTSFQFMRPSPTKNFNAFKKNGFEIKRISSIDTDKIYEEFIYILDGNNYYSLTLKTNDKNREEVQRFLFSIKVKNDFLFVKPQNLNYLENTISLNEVETNPEVIEAFKRKSGKNNSKVTTEISGKEEEFKSYKDYSRSLTILDRPFPSFLPKDPSSKNARFSINLEVEFLANGLIGNIKILNNENKSFTEACIDAVRKIKFIPAQVNDANVDSKEIINYSMETFTIVGSPILISPGQRRF